MRADLPGRFHLETLGCPKNAVDSDKLRAALGADGLVPASSVEDADLVVLNTCAFIEAAREESVERALALAAERRPGARIVLTGCMAERYGEELAAAMPEVDAVVGFSRQATIATIVGMAPPRPALDARPPGVGDLLDLPRPAPDAPWAYLKVAEGCDRACAFCAIPSFRGAQRSRSRAAVLAEARQLVDGGVAELVLVAQDLARYGRDVGERGALPALLADLEQLADRGLARVRLLYLYPSEVRDPLVGAMLDSQVVVPYFDLSLQHVSRALLTSMRRFGDGGRFARMIEGIRRREPGAVFRSSFIVGFPGETESDHQHLARFVEEVELDWAGFFPFSAEEGTAAVTLPDPVPVELARERLAELSEVQDRITAARRDAWIGREVEVLLDEVDPTADRAVGRTYAEAPEIDGVVTLRGVQARPGAIVGAVVTGAAGPDLEARPIRQAVRLGPTRVSKVAARPA